MSTTITVVTKAPGAIPVVRKVEKGLSALQGIVGGYIQSVPVPGLEEHRIDLWVNEDGKGLGLEPNLLLFGGFDVAVGTVFFASYDRFGNTRSLSKKQIGIVEGFIRRTFLVPA